MLWEKSPEVDRIRNALNNLAKVLGKQIYNLFLTGISYSWSLNQYSSGAFPMFKPGQETDLFPYIPTPEGRVHPNQS